MLECPNCGSEDIDLSEVLAFLWECQECGELFNRDYEEPEDYDWTPPDYGPPGSGAVVTEYQGNEGYLPLYDALDREIEQEMGWR